MAKFPQHLHPNNALDFITNNDSEVFYHAYTHSSNAYNLCHFWSNFEIGNLDFFRGEAYGAYFDHLDQAGGFYYERWGDAPVHSIGLALLLDRNAIHHFEDIGYYHAPYMACPQSREVQSVKRCICRKFDQTGDLNGVDNVVNGGSHADEALAFQGFMIVPTGAPTFAKALKVGPEFFTKKKYDQSAGNGGDEGGVAPDSGSPKEALDLNVFAIEPAGYTGQVGNAVDVASSEFCKEGKYDLDFKNPNSDASEWAKGSRLASLYEELIHEYPVVSFGDSFGKTTRTCGCTSTTRSPT